MRSASSGRPAFRKRTRSSALTKITPACPRQHAEQVRQSSSSAPVSSKQALLSPARTHRHPLQSPLRFVPEGGRGPIATARTPRRISGKQPPPCKPAAKPRANTEPGALAQASRRQVQAPRRARIPKSRRHAHAPESRPKPKSRIAPSPRSRIMPPELHAE